VVTPILIINSLIPAQTPVESTLPWKRDEDEEDESSFAVRQNEFPAWATNKDYLAYNSPTNTFLGKLNSTALRRPPLRKKYLITEGLWLTVLAGGLDRHDKMPTVIGMFKRDSVSSNPSSRRGSVQSLQQARAESPRHSIGSSVGSLPEFEPHQQSPSTPTILSRRGSVFAVSIPEEVIEETDKDLIDIESKKSSSASEADLKPAAEAATSSPAVVQEEDESSRQPDPDADDTSHTTQTKL